MSRNQDHYATTRAIFHMLNRICADRFGEKMVITEKTGCSNDLRWEFCYQWKDINEGIEPLNAGDQE